MPHHGKERRGTSSKLDKTWKLVVRAFPADSSARAAGQRLRECLDDDKADAAEINERFVKFRDRCDAMLSRELEHKIPIQVAEASKDIKLEDHLWDSHSHVNGWYRRQLEAFKSAKKKHVVEQRKVLKRFLEFVKSSQLYYRTHVAQLAANADGIPELEAIAEKVALEDVKPSEASSSSEQQQAVLASCFDALLHLGDLSRWREQARTEGEVNFGPAIGFYDLAATLRPDSGKPHHQLAVIAASSPEPDDLRIVYHFYRSLTAVFPHPKAEENLEQQFQKIMSRPSHQRSLSVRRQEESATVTDLISWHMQLHAMCRTGPSFDEYAGLEHQVIGYLTMNILELPMASVLKKLVMVNMAAEWVAKTKADRSEQGEVHLLVPRAYLLKLNVKTLDTMLALFSNELDKMNSPAYGFNVPSLPRKADDKVSVVMRRLLPSLVNYSSWLLTVAPGFTNHTSGDGPFPHAFANNVTGLWTTYAKVMSKLVNMFQPGDLPEIDYLLEEDEETIGFKPFQNRRLRSRYILGNHRKPDSGSVARHHPSKEMLGRVRRIITDGQQLVSMEGIPITVRATPQGRTLFEFQNVEQQSHLQAQSRVTPPRPAPPFLQHGHPQPAPSTPAAQRTPHPGPSSVSRPPNFSTPFRPSPQQGFFSPDSRYARMVSDIVDPDPDPNPPFPPNMFHLYPPRTRTPPEYSFESAADWLPGDDANGDDAAAAAASTPPSAGPTRRPRGSTDLRRPALDLGWGAYHEKAMRGSDEAMSWVAGEICQAEEPIIPTTHWGYSGGSGFRRRED